MGGIPPVAAGSCIGAGKALGNGRMFDPPPKPPRKPSWSRTLVRVLMICVGCAAILLPAWLPNRPSIPIGRGTVELLQAFLLAGAAAVMLGAAPHAGAYRPVCRVLALGLIAAFVGEIEDFISGILQWPFPEAWVIGLILLVATVTALRHRRVMVHFIATLGQHAGSGLIAAALLIIYVFNRVIGSRAFWQASLGDAFSPDIPKICKSYLELLACYLIFIGALGLSITLARRREPI
jgi:predicted membrane protein